jgi:1-acyl-sn-glycerol-3-phosphate acyltransferase
MSGARPAEATSERSPVAWRFMAAWFERYFRRHLNGLRVAAWGKPAEMIGRGPVVIYSNHPSWWDAAVYILLARNLFPTAESYAPIDSAMLRKYGFFARIGAIPVEQDGARGAVSFLRAGAEVLSREDRVLWVAAQGRFADARERPVGLRAGVARLAELAPEAWFLPLAIEYVFWTERGAEALVAFGPALSGRELRAMPRRSRLAHLEATLTATMDRLASDALARDPARFVAVTDGRPGIGGVYDGWRRLRAVLRGRRFEPAHGGRGP